MRIKLRILFDLMLSLALPSGLALLIFSSATAVVIRHDRDDAASLRLAQRFNAVGRILPDGCCTLIAPTWALTAAHVASSIPPDGQVQFGDQKYSVKRVVLHPEGVGPKGVPPEVDLALVELAEPVRQIEPVELYRERKEMGETIFLVGYGDYGNPSGGLRRSDGKRRAVTNVVEDAGPRRIFTRFDEPPGGTEYEGVGGPGDSGGPAILEEGGKRFLVGVSSASMNGKPGQYGVTDVYTRVSTYVSWVEVAMKRK